MDDFIEIEIENKSYIKLQDLGQFSKSNLKLTTLVDNQSGVIIKVFLNRDGERIPIKNLEVRHLPPKVSGLPRFELVSSYEKKRLHLILKVDGKKVNESEIKLAAYLRNRYLPLYIIIGIIVALLLIWSGKWVITNLFSETAAYKTSIAKADENTTKPVPSNTADTGSDQLPERKIIPEQSSSQSTSETPAEETLPYQTESDQTKESGELPYNTAISTVKQAQPAPPTVSADTASSTGQIVYFSPNNTIINRETSLLLKELAVKLKKNANAIVEISGHCAMSGTEAGREELSRERAYNIVAYLKQEGWVPETEPVIRWFGGTQPVTTESEEIFRNRRVEITVNIP